MAAIVDENSGAPAFLVWIIRAEDALHGMADAFPLGRLGAFFIAAFIVAFITVRAVLALIGRIGFTPFGYYRIALGGLMLLVLALR